MSKRSKRRKPQKAVKISTVEKPRTKGTQLSGHEEAQSNVTQATNPPLNQSTTEERIRSKILPKIGKRVWWVLVTAVGIAFGIQKAWPKFEISAVDMRDGKSPFSQAFEIKNTSFYPVFDVKLTTFSRSALYPNNLSLGMNSVDRQGFIFSKVDAGDPVTIDLNVVSGSPISAEAGIEMVYRPLSPLMFERMKLFRFILTRDAIGKYTWRRQPVDNEFTQEWEKHKIKVSENQIHGTRRFEDFFNQSTTPPKN